MIIRPITTYGAVVLTSRASLNVVQKAIDRQNKLSLCNRIYLVCVPAHKGEAGSELVLLGW